MLRLLDVYRITADPEANQELVASLDVTENTEAERLEILQAAKILYGAECSYTWHDCGHDDGVSCRQCPAE